MADASTEQCPALPEYVYNLLRTIANDAGFENFEYKWIVFHQGSNVGDGFLGQLVFVTLRSGVGDVSDLKLLCKLMPVSAETREEMNVIELFKRECFFYQTVFPEFEKFQTLKGWKV